MPGGTGRAAGCADPAPEPGGSGRAVGMRSTQRVQMFVGEGARLDLEAVVPVAVPQPLQKITGEGQITRLPLLQHVTVLMQHEPGIVEELLRPAAQVNAPPPGSGDGAVVQPRIK